MIKINVIHDPEQYNQRFFCRCLYEIENNLPRTQHCFVPCQDQIKILEQRILKSNKIKIMTLQKQIKADMVTAMKTKDTETLSLLRVVTGEFSRVGKELSDDEVLKVLRKMSNDAEGLGNDDEVEILEKYLPQMFTETHIRLAVNKIIQDNDYSGMKDMGNVMKELKSPSIDNKLASNIVREMLG